MGVLGGCALAERPTIHPPSPVTVLSLHPQIALISPGSSEVTIRAVLRVHNPTDDIRCAEESWDWGEGEAPSTHSEDCNPEDLEPWLADAAYVLSSSHHYRYAGKYDVVVTLRGSRGVLVSQRARVEILRPGGME